MLCPAAFIDYKAGGQVAELLAKVPEYEVTLPNAGDKLIMSAEVNLRASTKNNFAICKTTVSLSGQMHDAVDNVACWHRHPLECNR